MILLKFKTRWLAAAAIVSMAVLGGQGALAWVINFDNVLDSDNTNDGTGRHGTVISNQFVGGIPNIAGQGTGPGVTIFGDNFAAGRQAGGQPGNFGAETSDPTLANPVVPDTTQIDPGFDIALVFDATFGGSTSDSDLLNPVEFNGSGNLLPFGTDTIAVIQDQNDPGCPEFAQGFCSDPDDEGNQPAGQFIFEFDEIVNITSIYVVDVEFGENNQSELAEILLFGETDNFLASVFVESTDGDNLWRTIVLDTENVQTLVVELKGSGGITNIVGDTDVPEPMTLGMFGAGLVGLGWIRRRHNRKR